MAGSELKQAERERKAAPHEQGRQWERVARFYDVGCKLLFLPFGGERRVRRRFLGIANVVQGAALLDIGCATGKLTRMAAALAGSSGRAIGVDRSRAMLVRAVTASARADSRSRAEFVAADAAELPFPDSSFDRVLAFMVLHELPPRTRRAALHEAARVLRPGGKLVVADYNPDARGMTGLLLRGLVRVTEPPSAGDILRGLHLSAIDSLFRLERTAELLYGLVQVAVAGKPEPAYRL